MKQFFAITVMAVVAWALLTHDECLAFGTTYSPSGQLMFKDSMSRTYNNPGSAMIGTWLNNDIMNMGMRSKLKKIVQEKQQSASSPPAKAADYRLTDISASRQNVAEQFVNAAQGISPEERKALLTALKEGFKAVEKELPRKNNMSYAMAGIIATAITIGKGIDVPGEDIENLAAGFNTALGTSQDWKKASASQKQALYESTLVNIVLMIMESQAEDQGTKDIAVETARNILASFGVR